MDIPHLTMSSANVVKFAPLRVRNNCCVSLFFTGRQVLEVMAGERGEDATDLAEVIYRNTADLFFSPR